MPVIKKPEKTGIPVVDVLYSAEPDISPVPLAPAITREALSRAMKYALPNLTSIEGSLNNIYLRNLAETLAKVVPKKHIAPIKEIDVVVPKNASEILSEASNLVVRGRYYPDTRSIVLYKDVAGPTTAIHEIGHDLFFNADPRYIQKVMNYYMSLPLERIRGIQALNPTGSLLLDPSELFAEIYANKILNMAGSKSPVIFLEAIPAEIRNMPFRIKPYGSGLF